MKFINQWTILSSFIIITTYAILFTSCTLDSDANRPLVPDEPSQRITGLYPENASNIYDSAGQLHNEIAEAYLAGGFNPTTTAGTISQIEVLATTNSEFQLLVPSNYVSPTAMEIESILSATKGDCLDIIANSAMTTNSKLSLLTFLDTLMVYRDQQVDYDTIHQYVIDYEMSIINDKSLPATDSKVILTTTSIARYAFYFARKHKKKRPKDRDWEISWGNITAGTQGSDESLAKAIVMSTVCGIISNK